MHEWLLLLVLLTCQALRFLVLKSLVPTFGPSWSGSHTGWLEPETAIARGASGAVSITEHKVSLEHVEKLMQMLPEGFPICACAADVEEARALAKLGPTFIAVEPPELIGGDISVTTADPAIVSDTVAAVKEVNPEVRVLCGAGVKNGQDVTSSKGELDY